MVRARRLSVSRNNLIWLVVVLAAAAIGWFVGGWKVALVAAVLGLVVSEVFERRSRTARRTE